MTIQSGMRLGKLYGYVVNYTPGHVFGGVTCATVGVAGHILCGGYGYLGKSLGITSDEITASQVRNPKGDILIASNKTNIKSFWSFVIPTYQLLGL